MSIATKILDGMYSNFIPTAVGVFIALWVTNYAKDIEEKRLFRKMIDNSPAKASILLVPKNTNYRKNL